MRKRTRLTALYSIKKIKTQIVQCCDVVIVRHLSTPCKWNLLWLPRFGSFKKIQHCLLTDQSESIFTIFVTIEQRIDCKTPFSFIHSTVATKWNPIIWTTITIIITISMNILQVNYNFGNHTTHREMQFIVIV